MFERTVRSRQDTLTFTRVDGKCWAAYCGWLFRIEGENEKKVYFIRPDGTPTTWSYVWSDESKPYTTNWQGSRRKVIRKAMGHIDERMREDVKWPEGC